MKLISLDIVVCMENRKVFQTVNENYQSMMILYVPNFLSKYLRQVRVGAIICVVAFKN